MSINNIDGNKTNNSKPNLPAEITNCHPVSLQMCRECSHFENCWRLENTFVIKRRHRPDQFTLFPQSCEQKEDA